MVRRFFTAIVLLLVPFQWAQAQPEGPAGVEKASGIDVAARNYEQTFRDLYDYLGRSYPNFAMKSIDWKKVGDELLPRVKDVKDDEEFGLLCMELVGSKSHAPVTSRLRTRKNSYEADSTRDKTEPKLASRRRINGQVYTSESRRRRSDHAAGEVAGPPRTPTPFAASGKRVHEPKRKIPPMANCAGSFATSTPHRLNR